MDSTQPKMNFLRLNNDVKRLIMDHLDQADLHTICLVHPDLYALAQTDLYSHIRLPRSICSPSGSRPHPISSLLRTILRNPRFGARIRQLSCPLRGGNYGWHNTTDLFQAPKIPVRQADLSEAVAFVLKSEVPYTTTWIEELQNGTIDAYLAVLLANLPHLKTLHLGRGLLMETDLVGQLLRSILCDSIKYGLPKDTLQCLQYIDMSDREDSTSRLNTSNLLPLFYLPAATAISVDLDNPIGQLPWPTDLPPRAPKLVSLTLHKVQTRHLGGLLAAAPNLQSLSWCFSHPKYTFQPISQPPPIVPLDEVMLALDCVKDTLANLRIFNTFSDIDHTVIALPRVSLRTGSATHLKHLHQLKTLQIPMVFLLEYDGIIYKERMEDCLPPSLETLALTAEEFETGQGEHTFTAALRKWLPDVGAFAPNLKTLRLAMFDSELWLDETQISGRRELEELASKVGIALEFVEWRLTHEFY